MLNAMAQNLLGYIGIAASTIESQGKEAVSSLVTDMWQGAVQTPTVLPNLMTGQEPFQRSPSEGYVRAAAELAAKVYSCRKTCVCSMRKGQTRQSCQG